MVTGAGVMPAPTGKETMGIPQRGQNAVKGSVIAVDPRWGGLNPAECAGKVKLMTHPAYGERFFKNEDVASRESRGWKVIEYVDPTKMVARSPGRPRKE